MLTSGSLLAAFFILVEWRLASLPVLPLYLFRIKNVIIIYATTFLTGIVYYCNLYFLPSYYTDARGFTPVQAGIYLLPLVLIQSISSSSSGQLLSRTRYPKPYIVVGFSIWCVGAGLQSMFGLNTSKGTIAGYLILEGLGIGFTLQTIFRTLGGAIGLVVCTAIKNAVLKKELLKIPGITPGAVAAIIKSGPQVLVNSNLEGAVREAYMSSLHAVFILFIPITGLSAVSALFLKGQKVSLKRFLSIKQSVYLEGDRDVLPRASTPPNNRDNIELHTVTGKRDVHAPVVSTAEAPEKSGEPKSM
ncbi:hypothetical protein FRC10_004109 [Ceratobasidium sp. 414]|nr:hypothetical protein FRC10_004109 [Ceratobasidium sp. 414]